MMAKIINAKSQIGKTKKCESEIVLEFAETGNDRWINVYNGRTCIYQLIKIGYEWGLQSMDFRCANTDHLRQIADKLDELNGVELPEFLKEQA